MKLVKQTSGCFSGHSEELYDGSVQIEHSADGGVLLIMPTQSHTTTRDTYYVEISCRDLTTINEMMS